MVYIEQRIAALEKRMAALEKGPGQPEKVQPLQPGNLDWIDKLSSAIAAAMSEASHDIP